MCALYTITNWEVQNPERSFCTTMSDKLFSAVTYIWSWDLIGISFTRKVIREVCWMYPSETSQKNIEVQNLSQIVMQFAAMLVGKLTCFAFRLYASNHALSHFCMSP